MISLRMLIFRLHLPHLIAIVKNYMIHFEKRSSATGIYTAPVWGESVLFVLSVPAKR
jgi:hypothetical protein